MSPSEKLIFDLKGAGGNFTNASCQKKSALREKKTLSFVARGLICFVSAENLKNSTTVF